MSRWDPYSEPEFEGVFAPPVRPQRLMSMPPRMRPTEKLVDQVRVACDLDHETAIRVAGWAADWAERLGASGAEPVFDLDGNGPKCSWCGAFWPLCGHHHLSSAISKEES